MNHYKGKNGIEVIDVIHGFTDEKDGYIGYIKGNLIKYSCRLMRKGCNIGDYVSDLEKIKSYCDFAINYLIKKEYEISNEK